MAGVTGLKVKIKTPGLKAQEDFITNINHFIAVNLIVTITIIYVPKKILAPIWVL